LVLPSEPRKTQLTLKGLSTSHAWDQRPYPRRSRSTTMKYAPGTSVRGALVQVVAVRAVKMCAPTFPPNYPGDLGTLVVLPDGTQCSLRPIRPDDAGRLVEFHRNLSQRSTYLRFFTVHPTLSPKEVERFTTVDYVNRLAFVIETHERLIAVGRFDRNAGSSDAEVAFVVADDYQHHGLASLLLDELARAARARGIDTFVAETLCENKAMLDVFHHSGFDVSSKIDYGTVSLRFGIEMTESYCDALAARDDSRNVRRLPLVGPVDGSGEC